MRIGSAKKAYQPRHLIEDKYSSVIAPSSSIISEI